MNQLKQCVGGGCFLLQAGFKTISLLHLNEISLSLDEGSFICSVSLEHWCGGLTMMVLRTVCLFKICFFW